jgi:hypothetical protein
MGIINEVSRFEESVYQIERTDYIVGGENGVANAQAKALANRTKYLYDYMNTVISIYVTHIEDELGVGSRYKTPWNIVLTGVVNGSTKVTDVKDITIDTHIEKLTVNGYDILYLYSDSPVLGPVNPVYYAVRMGKSLFKDEDFWVDTNNVEKFGSGNSNIQISMNRILSGNPGNSSGRCLEFVHVSFIPEANQGTFGWGGFNQPIMTEIGKRYVHTFKAYLDPGYKFSIGADKSEFSTSYWLTNNSGTGRVEEYAYVHYVGSTAGDMGIVYITDGDNITEASPLIWRLYSSNIYDLNNSNGFDYVVSRLGFTPVNLAGDSMRGPLKLLADPESGDEGVPKRYVDRIVEEQLERQLEYIRRIAELADLNMATNVQMQILVQRIADLQIGMADLKDQLDHAVCP